MTTRFKVGDRVWIGNTYIAAYPNRAAMTKTGDLVIGYWIHLSANYVVGKVTGSSRTGVFMDARGPFGPSEILHYSQLTILLLEAAGYRKQ